MQKLMEAAIDTHAIISLEGTNRAPATPTRTFSGDAFTRFAMTNKSTGCYYHVKQHAKHRKKILTAAQSKHNHRWRS